MLAFKNLSIRAKLIALTTLCSSLALLLCSAGFVVNDMSEMRATKVEQIRSQAEALAFNSTAVLTFYDAPAASDLLSSLKLQPTVEIGCLYDRDGKPFALYSRTPRDLDSLPELKMLQGHSFEEDGYLDLFQPVADGDDVVGTLYLRTSLADLEQRIADYLNIAAVMLVGALAVSVILAVLLQRTISDPILQLSVAARSITNSDDYTIRVEPGSDDEIGALYHSFNQMLDQVETSRNALKSAVANMSHEIRTPINAILGFTELLQKDAHEGKEEERQDYLATISSSGRHLLGLINDILDLSKIESGQMDIERVRCSPHNVIAEVVSVLRVKANEKQLSLDYEWAGPLPETVETDPGRLTQMLMNLVGNSIKFTETGGVQILGRLEDEDGKKRLCIDVIDSGIGISADRMQAVFDPFVQADNTVTERFGGTGLGLSISRKLAVALGGDLQVRSVPGEGSTFTVSIAPGSLEGVRLLESAGREINLPGSSRGSESQVGQLPACRILVVDDGATNRKLIRLLLIRTGATVILAENGQIGYELAMKQDFDAILMDMQMPVLDGYTATAKLRSAGMTLPIIALTAHAMSDAERKCRAAGCSGYLTKPISGDLLVSTLLETLSIREIDSQSAPAIAVEERQQVPDVNASLDTPIYSCLPTDDEDFLEIVIEFIERAHERMAEVETAWKNQELQTVVEIAHWFKGSGGTAGFAELTEPAKQLEHLARNEQPERIDDALAELAGTVARIAVNQDEAATIAPMTNIDERHEVLN
jgi:two-component system, sensor histidine kinase